MPPIHRHGSNAKRWLAPWAAIAIEDYGYFRGSFGIDLQAVRGSTNVSFGPELGYIVEKHNGLMAGVRVTLGWL